MAQLGIVYIYGYLFTLGFLRLENEKSSIKLESTFISVTQECWNKGKWFKFVKGLTSNQLNWIFFFDNPCFESFCKDEFCLYDWEKDDEFTTVFLSELRISQQRNYCSKIFYGRKPTSAIYIGLNLSCHCKNSLFMPQPKTFLSFHLFFLLKTHRTALKTCFMTIQNTFLYKFASACYLDLHFRCYKKVTVRQEERVLPFGKIYLVQESQEKKSIFS